MERLGRPRYGRQGRRQWVPHVALCLFELASLAITDPTGKGDFHGDVDRVRDANAEDPHRKIHDGPRAVRPASASTSANPQTTTPTSVAR